MSLAKLSPGGAPTDLSSLDALRARIRELEGNHVRLSRIPSGVDAVDRLIEGLPCPGILEISGPLGGGRTGLAIALVAAQTGRQAVAWVDPHRRLYPPGFAARGVTLGRLVVLQPSLERTSWAVEQVARSGCFPVVVVDELPASGKSTRFVGQRWELAAEAGRCSVIVLTERPTRDIPACVRLSVGRGTVTVLRDRSGPSLALVNAGVTP